MLVNDLELQVEPLFDCKKFSKHSWNESRGPSRLAANAISGKSNKISSFTIAVMRCSKTDERLLREFIPTSFSMALRVERDGCLNPYIVSERSEDLKFVKSKHSLEMNNFRANAPDCASANASSHLLTARRGEESQLITSTVSIHESLSLEISSERFTN